MTAQHGALEELLPDIRRAARHIALEWPSVLSSEEIEQEITLHLLEWGQATVVLEFDPQLRRGALHKVGQQVASDEQVDYDHFSGNYRYSTKEIHRNLDRGILLDKVEDNQEYDFRFSIEKIDISSAFNTLSERDQGILVERFVTGSTETLSGADRKRVTRAVETLTNELNRAHKRGWSRHDGPGSRQIISNDDARLITKEQNGD